MGVIAQPEGIGEITGVKWLVESNSYSPLQYPTMGAILLTSDTSKAESVDT